MKILSVTTHVLVGKLSKPFGFSQYWYDTRRSLLVEVVTDDGLTGWGEAFGTPRAIAAVIDELTPLLIGRDPGAIDVIWELLYNRYRDRGQKGLVVSAISAIDLALWDLLGKRHGVPVHRLLGGPFRTEVQAYATGMYLQDVEDPMRLFQEEAVSYVEAGFQAVKMKVGFGVEQDFKLVKAVREAIGPGVALMVDANHAYDAVEAIRLGRRIAPYEIGWFEEPVCPEDLDGYRECRDILPMPIAGGESEWTRFGFRELLVRRTVDIVQPDVCMSGGLSEGKKIAIMANAFGVRCNPHTWGTGIAIAASLQFLAILPHNPLSLHPVEPMLEFDQTEHPYRMEVLTQPISHRDGLVNVPMGPGLGVEVNREAVLRFEER